MLAQFEQVRVSEPRAVTALERLRRVQGQVGRKADTTVVRQRGADGKRHFLSLASLIVLVCDLPPREECL
jgi:hypothetical protein